MYNNQTWTSSNPRISASPFYALIQTAQIQIQERRSQKPLEIGRFGPPPQKEGRSELGSEPLKLVRRFFFVFVFCFVPSFDGESCALLQFGSTGFKIIIIIFFWSNKQTNKHVCTHIHIWLHGGWGRKGGGGAHYSVNFGFQRKKKSPPPPLLLGRTFPPPSNRKL